MDIPIVIGIVFAVVFVAALIWVMGRVFRSPDPKTTPPIPNPREGKLKAAFENFVEVAKKNPPITRDKLKTLLTDENKAKAEAALKTVGQFIAPQKIFMTETAVVTYRSNIERPLELLASEYSDSVDEKLKEILAIHPDADLTKFETALGIKIVDVQRRGTVPPPQQPKKLPDEDNELGEIE